jgi:hypothetical protein
LTAAAGITAAGRRASRGSAAAGFAAALARTQASQQADATTATAIIRAAAIAAAVATRAAMAAVTGDRNALLTAHEGDADHRDEHRDAKHQCTIHSEFLQQKQNWYVPLTDTNYLPSRCRSQLCDGRHLGSEYIQHFVQTGASKTLL